MKVCSKSSSTITDSESIEQEHVSDNDDIEEQGFTTEQEAEKITIDEAIRMMLKRAEDNGASK